MTTGFSMQKLIGLILVVVVVIFAIFMMFPANSIADTIRNWHLFGDEDELGLGTVTNLDQLFNAYEICKTFEGSGCLCDSMINLNLEEGDENTIKISEKSTLGGIRLKNNKGEVKYIENVRHCFQNNAYSIDDKSFRLGDPESVLVNKYKGELIFSPEISPRGGIEGTLKLYRYVKDEGGKKELYLCFTYDDLAFDLCTPPPGVVGGVSGKPGGVEITKPGDVEIEVKEIASGVLSRVELYSEIIRDTSIKYGVDENLIKAVIAQDSIGIYHFVSSCGEAGLMQLTPLTAKENGINEDEIYDYASYGVLGSSCDEDYANRLISERAPIVSSGLLNEEQRQSALSSLDARFNPTKNIDAGVGNLKQQLDNFGDEGLALVAYITDSDTVTRFCDIEKGLGSCSVSQGTLDYVVSVLGYNLYLQSL